MIIQDEGNIKSIQKFLEKNWKKKHILAINSKIFNWFHYNPSEKKYNFLIFKKKSNILGFLGILKNSKFSNGLIFFDTIWLTTWVAKKAELGVGIALLMHSIKCYKYSTIGTIGCNKKARTIYKKMGFRVGNMKHYFSINSKIKSFKIIMESKKISKTHNKYPSNKRIEHLKGDLKLKIFGNDVDELVKKYGKDETYFKNRYINHPYYKYKIYLIYDLKIVVGFFVTRICIYKKRKALRIVDFFGQEKALIDINPALQKLIVQIKAEYVDFYEQGIKNSIMLKSGLTKNRFNSKIIIPNYFEPFLKRNINLGWAIKTNNTKVSPMFKGDCDQDRPSSL
jgi:hypothetical protein